MKRCLCVCYSCESPRSTSMCCVNGRFWSAFEPVPRLLFSNTSTCRERQRSVGVARAQSSKLKRSKQGGPRLFFFGNRETPLGLGRRTILGTEHNQTHRHIILICLSSHSRWCFSVALLGRERPLSNFRAAGSANPLHEPPVCTVLVP